MYLVTRRPVEEVGQQPFLPACYIRNAPMPSRIQRTDNGMY